MIQIGRIASLLAHASQENTTHRITMMVNVEELYVHIIYKKWIIEKELHVMQMLMLLLHFNAICMYDTIEYKSELDDSTNDGEGVGNEHYRTNARTCCGTNVCWAFYVMYNVQTLQTHIHNRVAPIYLCVQIMWHTVKLMLFTYIYIIHLYIYSNDQLMKHFHLIKEVKSESVVWTADTMSHFHIFCKSSWW